MHLTEDQVNLLRFISERQLKSQTPKSVFVPLSESWLVCKNGQSIAQELIRYGLLRATYEGGRLYYPCYSLSQAGWELLQPVTLFPPSNFRRP